MWLWRELSGLIAEVDISVNHFELFGLQPDFALSLSVLAVRYRELQSRFHPDKYAAQSQQEQRIAMQYSTHINDAYHCLKSPLSRAGYLLSLNGLSVDFGSRTISDGDFLMQQMMLREELADIADIADIDKRENSLSVFRDALRVRIDAEQCTFVDKLSQGDMKDAADSVARLHFIFKLDREADEHEAQLDD